MARERRHEARGSRGNLPLKLSQFRQTFGKSWGALGEALKGETHTVFWESFSLEMMDKEKHRITASY